ncbi:U4/U6 small nuclear ribonucleoprotein Prp3 [Hydra vulgaris]|nr:U4/U6 small nuclear ribonucleoprotein Prp3 [Hydra vulgaris]
MATLSKKDIDDLQPIIRETVSKRLGFPEKAVMRAALSCIVDNLDNERSTEKMASLLGDDLAPRFVEELMNNVSKFRSSAINRKRSAEDEDTQQKKAKLNRLNALIDDEPLPPTLPETAPDKDQLLDSASNISEIVASMKRQIEQRKRMLINSGVAPALIENQERIDKRLREEQARENLLNQFTDKQRRAAELQYSIQSKLSGKLGLLSGFSKLPIKTAAEMNAIPITEMTRPAAVVLDDQGNAIDQATGRQIQIIQRMPTLKVNIREKKKDMFNMTDMVKEEEEERKHYDPRVGIVPAQRGRRNFNFHKAGKFQLLAQKMRAKAQMEKLQKQIQAVAKKTGISSATKLAQVAKQKAQEMQHVPDIEWWDIAILPNQEYSDFDRELKPGEERFINITRLVEHPYVKDAPCAPKNNVPMPIFLTKKERKKIRTQRRRENEKEKQEKIRLGLEPPPPPKVKISNLMRVLATEAVQDPTKVEAHVRAQMAARQKKHEAANEERKLTKEERALKKVKKLKEDLSTGVHTSLYKLLNISNPAKKFKVDTNAQQLYLTGCVIITKGMALVITEGGPKSQKKFKKLMLSRIKWEEDSAQGMRQDKIDKKNNEVNVNKKKNECKLIWEGTNIKKTFTDWRFHVFKTDPEAHDFLRRSNVEHFWNLAASQTVLEEADS